MYVGQDCIFVIYRDGKPFKHFGSKQVALNYIAACCDLEPGSLWELKVKEVRSDD